jgi:TonB family protein
MKSATFLGLILAQAILSMSQPQQATPAITTDERDTSNLSIVKTDVRLTENQNYRNLGKCRNSATVVLTVQNLGQQSVNRIHTDIVFYYIDDFKKMEEELRPVERLRPFKYNINSENLSHQPFVINPSDTVDLLLEIECLDPSFVKEAAHINFIQYADGSTWERRRRGEIKVFVDIPDCEPEKLAEPIYPPLAHAALVVGRVVVKVEINEKGDVISATVISGHPLLKDASLVAARKCRFRLKDNQEKSVTGTITFNFQI